jgi:Arc/MetJ-type ribon-helix-helix transcriptional regulator
METAMPYPFPPELDRLIQEELATGEYASADDVLLAALQALRERDEAVAGIQAGLADLDSGRVRPLDSVDAELRRKYDIRRDA